MLTVVSLVISSFGIVQLKRIEMDLGKNLDDEWWFVALPVAVNVLQIILVCSVSKFDVEEIRGAQNMVTLISLAISIFGYYTLDMDAFKKEDGANAEWWFTIIQITVNLYKMIVILCPDRDIPIEGRIHQNVITIISVILTIYGIGTFDYDTFKEHKRGDNEVIFTALQFLVDTIHAFLMLRFERK